MQFVFLGPNDYRCDPKCKIVKIMGQMMKYFSMYFACKWVNKVCSNSKTLTTLGKYTKFIPVFRLIFFLTTILLNLLLAYLLFNFMYYSVLAVYVIYLLVYQSIITFCLACDHLLLFLLVFDCSYQFFIIKQHLLFASNAKVFQVASA